MSVAYAVVGVVLAFGLLAVSTAQITHNKAIVAAYVNLGISLGLIPFLASCLIAGAIGLLIGLWYAPLGIAAAACLVLYFIGALIAHLRKGDVKGLPMPTLFLGLAAAALCLQILPL